MTFPGEPEVRAAGGAVWRRDGEGELQVVLVHRPRYDDWSLPKGKVEPGETDEDAARREVEEEAGVIGRLGPELTSTSYTDHRGRSKIVRYWAMTVAAGEVGGDNEVDIAVWRPISTARQQLSYGHDVAVLDHLERLLAAD